MRLADYVAEQMHESYARLTLATARSTEEDVERIECLTSAINNIAYELEHKDTICLLTRSSN